MGTRTASRRTTAALGTLLLVAAGAAAQERSKTSLVASDGQPLVGTTLAPKDAPKGGVLLLPGRGSNRVAFDPLLSRLGGSGLLVLALDPRGHGDSVNDKDGRRLELGKGVPADPTKGPFVDARLDAEAGLDHLIARGAPKSRLAVVAAGSSAAHALDLAARGRAKAVVLLTPEAEETGLDLLEPAARLGKRPALVLATAEDAERGFDALKGALTAPEAEFRALDGTLARGTAVFGRVPGIEATLASWIVEALETPTPVEIGAAPTVVIDGVPSPDEAALAAVVHVPLGSSSGDATVRLSTSKRSLDVAFDVPERYVRLNEAIIYLDASGEGPRAPDRRCYRVSFSPKNPARKPVLVQRGGLKGFEDADDKGVVAFARVDDKARWTAEISLDLERFCGGPPPRAIRLALQVNGQRATDLRFWPETPQVATAPRFWAKATLK